MREFFKRLSEALDRGPVALATVVSSRGSTPRVAGARQFLTSSGEHEGTIGGGVAEARVLELAKETLADGKRRNFEADLRGRIGDIRDGICGGIMSVWIVRIERIDAQPILDILTRALDQGKCVTLSLKPDEKCPLAIEAGSQQPISGETLFTETIEPSPRLLIVGAGHIGRSLAHIAARLAFDVVVQDDRPEWLAKGAFPQNSVLESKLETAINQLRHWEGGRFLALVTRGFPQDLAALKAWDDGFPLNYLGILGSKARLATVISTWREGKAHAPLPSTLHAPIGIEIGAETPEEIAVSIAAEIIQVWRREREATVRSLS